MPRPATPIFSKGRVFCVFAIYRWKLGGYFPKITRTITRPQLYDTQIPPFSTILVPTAIGSTESPQTRPRYRPKNEPHPPESPYLVTQTRFLAIPTASKGAGARRLKTAMLMCFKTPWLHDTNLRPMFLPSGSDDAVCGVCGPAFRHACLFYSAWDRPSRLAHISSAQPCSKTGHSAPHRFLT